MKRKNHSVIRANAVHHIYQNTPNGYLIFYSVKDRLVFYSIVSVVARRYDVQILGLCLMYDHIHLVVYSREPDQLRSFIRDYTGRFTRMFNRWYGFKGSLFNTPPGCVPKPGHKNTRTAIAYLYNNHVECHLFDRAEKAQWNFLAYAVEKAPFSEKLRMDYARWELRKALKLVKEASQQGRPLEYVQLEQVTKDLSARELKQFIDYMVRQYAFIDYEALIRYYGSYDDLVTAVNSNTGSEYDLNEDTSAKDHRIYQKMLARLCNGTERTMKDILGYSSEERSRLARSLQLHLGATKKEVAKLLRL